jgi:hypothetical protein
VKIKSHRPMTIKLDREDLHPVPRPSSYFEYCFKVLGFGDRACYEIFVKPIGSGPVENHGQRKSPRQHGNTNSDLVRKREQVHQFAILHSNFSILFASLLIGYSVCRHYMALQYLYLCTVVLCGGETIRHQYTDRPSCSRKHLHTYLMKPT